MNIRRIQDANKNTFTHTHIPTIMIKISPFLSAGAAEYTDYATVERENPPLRVLGMVLNCI